MNDDALVLLYTNFYTFEESQDYEAQCDSADLTC